MPTLSPTQLGKLEEAYEAWLDLMDQQEGAEAIDCTDLFPTTNLMVDVVWNILRVNGRYAAKAQRASDAS